MECGGNEKKKLVLIGNGMAGIWCIEQLLKLNPNQYDITVFGEEPHPNYNRILLSKVLAGDSDMNDIILNSWEWYREKQYYTSYRTLCKKKLTRNKKTVTSDGDITVSYDELIFFATGSLPIMLPLPGADKEGVIAFRDIKDCEAMLAAAKEYKKAIVIGGGLLGLEAARGLLNLNMEVSVVHLAPYLMERQLDATASRMLQQELEKSRHEVFFDGEKNSAEIFR
ncbi:hypothetical protein GCM10020331_076860 [Ectobacillus funiculus]